MALLTTLRRAALCACAALVLATTTAAGEPLPEYRVKMGFVYKFTKFVTWPGPPRPVTDPFDLCIVGRDPFGTEFDRSVREPNVGVRGRSIQLHRLGWNDDPRICELLFVSRSLGLKTRAYLASLKNAPILTVGDTKTFLEDGGMIALVVEGRAVRFDIDMSAMRRAKIHPSTQILEVARRRHGEPDRARTPDES